MANDGTVKIGVDVSEKEFKAGLSKISKTAERSLSAIGKTAGDGFSSVGKGLEKTNATISTTSKKLKELDKALKLDPKNVELLDQKQRLLAQSAEATAEKYEQLKRVAESSTVSNVVFRNWEEAQASLQKQIDETVNEIQNLEDQAKKLEGLGLSPDSSSIVEIRQRAEAANEKLTVLEKTVDDTYEMMGRPISIDQWDDLQRELSETKIAADKAQESFENFSPAFSVFSSMADDVSDKAGKVAEATKGISLAAGGVLTAMIGSAKGTEEFRSDLAKLNTNAQLAGVGVESTRNALMQLNAVSDETDSSVEALSNLLQAGASESTLQQAVENLAGAAVSFPDTVKIESLADSLQESLATGEATGQFAEVLNRLGVSTEEFNFQLAQVPGTVNKLHFALDTLQKEGLAGVYQAWAENNGALLENKNASFEFQESLSRLGEEMQPLMTTVTELAGAFLDWFNGLSDGQQEAIVALLGIVAAISPVASAISSVSGAVNMVTKNFDGLKTAVSGVFGMFTSNPMLLAIGAVSAALLLLILNWDKVKETAENVINAVVGFIENAISAVQRFFSALNNGGGKTGSNSVSPKNASGNTSRTAPAARTSTANEATDDNGGEGYSLAASTFSRASAVRALESAIPNAESRVAVATAAMTPAAGYSAPPAFSGGGGNTSSKQAPIILRPNWTIQFQGDTAQLGRVLNPIIKNDEHRLGPGV